MKTLLNHALVLVALGAIGSAANAAGATSSVDARTVSAFLALEPVSAVDADATAVASHGPANVGRAPRTASRKAGNSVVAATSESLVAELFA
jgi:hypothetical protein